MILILKIPIAYLCGVVYWAIKAEPRPLDGAALPAVLEPSPQAPDCPWRSRRPRPRLGGPARRSGTRPQQRVHAPLRR